MLRSKDEEIGKRELTINQVLKRESAVRDQLARMEFLYDLDPNKPLIKYDKGGQQLDKIFDPVKLDKFPTADAHQQAAQKRNENLSPNIHLGEVRLSRDESKVMSNAFDQLM